MTQEEKSLLLKDLCARLPYNCRVFYEYIDDLDGRTYGYSLTLNTWCIDEFVANKAVIKPCLRPMSSMTEEEKKIFLGIRGKSNRNKISMFSPSGNIDEEYKVTAIVCSLHNYSKNIDWLNANHFDYRGLIPKGLAIEVTKDNNPYEE